MPSETEQRHIRTANGGRYIRTLDGWRALAILLVLLDHRGDALLRTLQRAGLAGLSWSVTHEQLHDVNELVGCFGVHIFFVISGYLITTRLLDEQARKHAVDLSAFYWRRLFRIQPAAFLYLAAVLVLDVLHVINVSPLHFVSAVFGFANYAAAHATWYTGHFWSLAVEQHFYLLWPLLFVRFGDQRLRGAAYAMGVVLLWRAVCIKLGFGDARFAWLAANYTVRTDTEVIWLLGGCLAALALADARWSGRLLAATAPRLVWLALPLALLCQLQWQLDWKLLELAEYCSVLGVILVMMKTVHEPSSWLGRLLETRPLAWLGRISFSLYLWQQLFCVWEDQRSPLLAALQSSLPLSLAAALLLAAVSFYTVEEPMHALGRTLLRRMRAVETRALT